MLFLMSCGGKNIETSPVEIDKEVMYTPPIYSVSDCGTEQDYDIYKLNEKYFDKEDIITMKLRVIYFMNGIEKPIDTKTIKRRIELSNQYFANAKLQFQFNGIEYIEGKPEDNELALENIEAIETIMKTRRNDIRNQYFIEHFDFWNTIFGKDGTMTAYVYDNVDSGYAGIAGGIGSTYFAIRSKFINPKYHTWEHELGHDLGLYHTHEPDPTNGLNSETGDMVCDTYASVDTLINNINEDCEFTGQSDIPNEHIEILIKNIMSYTRHECRANFTPVQNMRKRKIIETNADLRRTIVGYDDLTKRIWKNLKQMD